MKRDRRRANSGFFGRAERILLYLKRFACVSKSIRGGRSRLDGNYNRGGNSSVRGAASPVMDGDAAEWRVARRLDLGWMGTIQTIVW